MRVLLASLTRAAATVVLAQSEGPAAKPLSGVHGDSTTVVESERRLKHRFIGAGALAD